MLHKIFRGLEQGVRMQRFRLGLLLILGVGLASCGGVVPESGAQASEPGTSVSLPTVTLTPEPTATSTLTPSATPGIQDLLVLHTNDNWGETEPCG